MSALLLTPGDLVPRLVLPDAAGQPVDLAHQSRAGRPLVLWLAGASVPAAGAAAFAERLADFAACEALVFAVLRAAPGVATGDGGGLPVLCDPDGIVWRAFGVEGTGAVIVIDAAARLVEAVPGGDAAAALARLGTIDDGGPAPVLTIPQVLEPALCRQLVAYWESSVKMAGGTSTGAGVDLHYDGSIKRRADVAIGDRALYEAVGERIRRRIFPQVLRAFQVRLDHVEAPRIGCYAAADAGFFGRHRDNRTPHTAHRLFAMSLNLGTEDYAGGELRFPEFGRTLHRPAAGCAVVFSCALLHEVAPVTRGRRFAVFSFFTDAAGRKTEEALIAAERARGNPGVRLR